MVSDLPLPAANEPFSLPLAFPHPSATPAPARPPLTPEQQSKLDKLTSHFNAPSFALPTTLKALKHYWKAATHGGGTGRGWGSYFRAAEVGEEAVFTELDDREKCYWSKEGFLRVLRATKWNLHAAIRRAEESCVWRREYEIESMRPEQVSKEAETGKEIVFGYDVNARPVLYMHPYRQNTATSHRQIEFVVWCLERTIDLCPATDPATEMICLCIDFGASRTDNKSQPTSLGQAKRVLHILQTYYCERLGRAVCADVPGFFYGFYTLVSPFVDPVTKDKIRFLAASDATDLVPPAQLQKLFGGEADLQYNHETYFPALAKLCDERKAENLARWRKYGGGKCGLSETVIRGAVVPDSVGAVEVEVGSEVVGGQGEKLVEAPKE